MLWSKYTLFFYFGNSSVNVSRKCSIQSLTDLNIGKPSKLQFFKILNNSKTMNSNENKSLIPTLFMWTNLKISRIPSGNHPIKSIRNKKSKHTKNTKQASILTFRIIPAMPIDEFVLCSLKDLMTPKNVSKIIGTRFRLFLF